MFMPKFRDLVRTSATVEGTGPVAPGAASAGFTSFADALSVGDEFYYTLKGLDKPAEREVGRGMLLADGTISRSPIEGDPVAFSEGAKTIALIAPAEYFAGADGAAVRGGQSMLPVSASALFAAAAPVELARTAIVTADFAGGINFNLLLTNDTLLADPINLKAGQSGRIRIGQDAVGGRTLDFGPRWQFAGGPPVLSSGGGAVDIVAYFVNGDGGVEASVLRDLNVRPIPQSVSDFKNGIYRVGSTAMSFEAMWAENLLVAPFIAGSVIPGVGWRTVSNTTTLNSLSATGEHLAGIGGLRGGRTFVVDYELNQVGGTKPRIVLDIVNMPEYLEGWGYYQNGSSYVAIYDYNTNYQRVAEPAAMGDSKVAVTLGPDGFAYSRNGQAPIVVPGNPMDILDVNTLAIHCYTSHDDPNPSTATMRSVTIYPVQPTSKLAELSA